MQNKYETLRRINPETAIINEWAKKSGVKIILFDLDDTLIETREIFVKQMGQCYDVLLPHLTLSLKELKSTIEKINDRSYEIYGVNPHRWDHVLEEFCSQFHLSPDVFKPAMEALRGIYTTIPRFKEGAENILQTIKESDVSLGIVTHANIPWTKYKFESLKLERFCHWYDIFIVNEDGHKAKKEWGQAQMYFNVQSLTRLTADNFAVCGDSIRSDIIPASENNIRHRFWIRNSARWSVQDGGLPPGTYIVPEIGKLTDAMENPSGYIS